MFDSTTNGDKNMPISPELVVQMIVTYISYYMMYYSIQFTYTVSGTTR